MFEYSLVGFVLVIAGIVTILLAIVTSSRGERRTSADVKGAGVIMIGPIPIIFGTDTRWLIVAILLAIVLVALGLIAGFR
jgi:uncharacterized protein (TIGR00304 family)